MNIYNKTDIRPIIKGIDTISDKSIEERFQNETLRPIIKLQHDLIVAYFKEYLRSKKKKLIDLSLLKQKEYIALVFKTDNTFKTELKGIIIGHFTTLEYGEYCLNKSDYNKRILTMTHQRIISVIELF